MKEARSAPLGAGLFASDVRAGFVGFQLDSYCMTAGERFWAKVEKTDDDCWLWIGGTNGIGYGRFMPDGRRLGNRRLVYAHRYAYELMIGPISDGYEIDHLCRNPSCVRPEHLEAVTHAENLRRSVPATRSTCKRGHPRDGYTASGLLNDAYDRSGKRYCRTCNNENQRLRRLSSLQ